MKIEPKNKWLIVEPADEPSMVRGLYVPGNITDTYKMGRVVAVSDDVEMDIETGSFIAYDSLGTVSMRFESSTVYFVKAVNVLGVITKP